MYAVSTWLIIFGLTVKPCIESVHMLSETNATGIFWRSYIGGRDITFTLQMVAETRQVPDMVGFVLIVSFVSKVMCS